MDMKSIDHPECYFRFLDYPDQPTKMTVSIIDYQSIPLVSLEQAIQPLIDQISSINQMLKLVQQKCRQPKNNLSPDESASIMLYTLEWIPQEQSFYYIFNRILSSQNFDEFKPWYLYMKLFAVAISKLPSTTRRIFYRIIPFDLHEDYPYKRRLISFDYISCSTSLNFFNRTNIPENSTVFTIFSQHAIDISEHSFYSLKDTFLLPCNQQYQVISCRTSNNGLSLIMLKELVGKRIEPTSINDEEYQLFDQVFQKQLIKREKGTEINLRNRKLTDSHMQLIVQHAIKTKNCDWLSLENNRITSHGLTILAQGLTDNQTLQSLHLSQNFIDDVGIEDLTKILINQYTNLTFLNLNFNSIGNDGAKYLANALKTNTILIDLWLAHNEIGNDGIQALAEVLIFDNSTLIQLYLNGNSLIDDFCIYSMIRLIGLNQVLNTIYLYDCSLTEQGKDVLENASKARFDLDLYV